LGLNFQEAEELKLQYSGGELPVKRAEEVRQALEADLHVWFSGIELTLGEFTNVDLLPSRILLCGGGSALPDISTLLRTVKWSKKLPFARKPSVHFIKPVDVSAIEDKTALLTNPWDITPMALANVAIDLVGEETVVDGILSKVVGALRQ